MKNAIIGFILLVVLASLAPGQSSAPKSKWAKFEENKVHYYDTGGKQDKALIFVHGWTCNADFWKDSYSAFPRLRVIALDGIFCPIDRSRDESRENKAGGPRRAQHGHARHTAVLPALSAGP